MNENVGGIASADGLFSPTGKLRFWDYQHTSGPTENPASKRIKPTEMFKFEANVGVIEVPIDYIHDTALGDFVRRSRYWLKHFCHTIHDGNYSAPSVVMKSRERYAVQVHVQTISGCTTVGQRLEYIENVVDGAVYLGPQGLCLFCEQLSGSVPSGRKYCSLDKVPRLGEGMDFGLIHGVPCIEFANLERGRGVSVELMDPRSLGERDALLVFTKI